MASQTRKVKRNGAQIKRAIAYARFSSNNQREESIDAQLRAIREYCEKNGIVLVDVFTDEAISGKTDNRDDFQKMVKGVLKGRYDVDAILVHKFNRFARNKYDSALYKKRLREIGVRVVSVTQKIDDTPEGELLEGFLEVIDQYYSSNLSVEVRKGLKENALKGKHAGGQVLFGFSLDSEGYYIPNENAPIVKRIFEEFAAGVPKSEICERLNKEGCRNQRNKPFNTRTLYDLLRNEKYIGVYEYTIDRTETIRLENVIKDPIIDKRLWNTVQQLNHEGSTKGRYRKQKRYYHLTGKAFCSCCGSPISGAGSKRSRNGTLNYYYKCVGKVKHKNGCDNPSLNKDWFEPRVLKSVVNAVMTGEQIKHIAKLTYQELEEMREKPLVDVNTLNKELDSIAKKQEMLTDLLLEGQIDKDMLNTKNASLNQRKFEIQEELEKRKMIVDSDNVTEEMIVQYIQEYVEYLKTTYTAEEEFMRAVLNEFVEKVEVDKENITVYILCEFSHMDGGDNEWFSGASHHLPPAKMKRRFSRKRNIRNKNS
jgi:DNA invertase Pin-like site-specific DNA recombinase